MIALAFQGSIPRNIQITKGVNIDNNIQRNSSKNLWDFFAISKFFLQEQNKNYFKKVYHWLFNNHSIELNSSSKNDYIIQEGEVIFKENLALFFGARFLSPSHVV